MRKAPAVCTVILLKWKGKEVFCATYRCSLNIGNKRLTRRNRGRRVRPLLEGTTFLATKHTRRPIPVGPIRGHYRLEGEEYQHPADEGKGDGFADLVEAEQTIEIRQRR